ncbi:hypothetical protein RHI9324_04961 [Rhizobium sp. CECT 9324]|nr:hypothetical protein RHI9324_04961 [Rhizobium sp. CECT 9324]
MLRIMVQDWPRAWRLVRYSQEPLFATAPIIQSMRFQPASEEMWD